MSDSDYILSSLSIEHQRITEELHLVRAELESIRNAVGKFLACVRVSESYEYGSCINELIQEIQTNVPADRAFNE